MNFLFSVFKKRVPVLVDSEEENEEEQDDDRDAAASRNFAESLETSSEEEPSEEEVVLRMEEDSDESDDDRNVRKCAECGEKFSNPGQRAEHIDRTGHGKETSKLPF